MAMAEPERDPLPPRRGPWIAIGVGAVVVALGIVLAMRHGTPPPAAMPAPGPAFQVVGFYENSNPPSWPDFQKYWRKLTTVSPRWFSVTASGQVVDIGYDPTMVAFAKRHHILVVPLVTNANGTAAMLTNSAVRLATARRLARLVAQDQLDGLDIDFELLPPSARVGLTDFVVALRRALPADKVLAICVFPVVGVGPAVNGADAYGALAHTANYLVLMAYDHHYSGGPPGPVAPYGWVQQNVAAATRLVPAKRLVLAIGMYGYDWVNNGQAGPATSLSDIQAKALAAAHGVTPQYRSDISQNTFTYTTGHVSHVVWYMGDRSARARVQLARRYQLAGIGLWRLGYEDPAFWTGVP
jgi:spore germination protein